MLNFIKNSIGWKTSKKIIVLESDDWGSIRMPSNKIYDYYVKAGAKLNKCRYNTFDSLESNDDLYALFDTLCLFKDKNGNHPVITAMSIVANPDFEKIKNSEFQKYYYEPFTKTLERYPNHNNVYKLYEEGIRNHIFVPQFHGREHLNANQWIEHLKQGNKGVLEAFDNELTGLSPEIYPPFSKKFQAAFDLINKTEINLHKEIIKEGKTLFKELFGYNATVFTPPNGPLNSELEPVLAKCGVNFIQTARIIYYEPLGSGRHKKHFRYLGKQNAHYQRYLIRNCVFEPNEVINFDWVGKCMKEITFLFSAQKPVILTTHRVNYMGFLNPNNRINGLSMLKQLLSEILKKWPDVEFMTTNELGDLINIS